MHQTSMGQLGQLKKSTRMNISLTSQHRLLLHGLVLDEMWHKPETAISASFVICKLIDNEAKRLGLSADDLLRRVNESPATSPFVR